MSSDDICEAKAVMMDVETSEHGKQNKSWVRTDPWSRARTAVVTTMRPLPRSDGKLGHVGRPLCVCCLHASETDALNKLYDPLSWSVQLAVSDRVMDFPFDRNLHRQESETCQRQGVIP